MSAGRHIAQFRVFGRVQGVGFRHFVTAAADDLGLSGWVRNRSDGSVEVRAEGAGEAIAALLAACNEGPRAARVARIEHQDPPSDGAAAVGFHARPTL